MKNLSVGLLLGFIALLSCARADSTQQAPQQRPPPAQRDSRVFKDRIRPYWFANNTRFWYRNDLPHGAREFVMVDVQRGIRQQAFDHPKLTAALARETGREYRANQLPFDTIEFVGDGTAIRFTVDDVVWQCDLNSYQLAKQEPTSTATESADRDRDSRATSSRRRNRGQQQQGDSPRSPDGQWTAFVRDHNVFVRANDNSGREIQLSRDGREGLPYGHLSWSPSSRALVAFRIEPGDRKEVYLIESSPQGGGRAKLHSRPYALPGDKFPTYEVNVFDIAGTNHIKPEVDRFEHEWLRPELHWSRDNQRFAYQQVDRGHQRLRVIEVDITTGKVRNLVDERSNTFIWTVHTENLGLNPITWLEQTDELIHASECSGWRHLYLVDTTAGTVKNPITRGEWVVRGIDLIDETNRVVWFHASGVYPDQDPYFIHYGRVNFDGSNLVFLTDGNGTHSIQYSPDRQYIIDSYSRVDQPPIHELRRVHDGKLVCKLEEADITQLEATGWKPPIVFVAKGRDGTTDIWGIICPPKELDPNSKYPIIEDIYAGPQSAYVPKSFSPVMRYESLTQLGFVVVKIDGMGTAHRSKAFHDVCWHNLKDAGLPDRILWIKAAAAKYPYMDISRVGVYGNSAGGQNAAAAVLFHPEFYKAAVASCGCHDNRMDKASWNEQWMGYPVGPHYAENSNIENARLLRGHLFLVVGEMDDNVPPESTYRFVDALIKANKDFDLLVIPGGGHGPGGEYGARRRNDFFVRHLLGVNPPNRNAQSAAQPQPSQ